jgi:hypothetical protein
MFSREKIIRPYLVGYVTLKDRRSQDLRNVMDGDIIFLCWAHPKYKWYSDVGK